MLLGGVIFMLLSSQVCLDFRLSCVSRGVGAEGSGTYRCPRVSRAGSRERRSLWCLESGDCLHPAPMHSVRLSLYLPLCLLWFVLLRRTASVLLSPGSAARLRGHPGERGGGVAEQGPCPGPGPGPRRGRSLAAGPATRPDPRWQELCRPATSQPPREPCC